MVETQTASRTDFQNLFRTQVKKSKQLAQSSAKDRIKKIKKIEAYINDQKNFDELQKALFADFSKPEAETLISETGVVLSHARFVRKHIHRWMRDEEVPTNITAVGTSSYIKYEPKGVVLLMAPWNYPFNLSLLPLVYAIASGNASILKPSEVTTHTSAYLKKMLAELFDEDEVAVVEGGIPETTELLKLPFNHIFFTGSPNVGKIVMAAAAKNLTSVTLELGGKSPAIVDESANAKKSAHKMAWGKCFNMGQTCIAPDYAFVHESKKTAFIDGFKEALQKYYNTDGKGIKDSPDLCRLVNDKNFLRVKALIDDAVSKGAKIAIGGEMDAAQRYISPTVLIDVNDDMQIMQEEIFGPVLPVVTYKRKEEVVDAINSRPKPLSMYIDAKKKKNIDYFIYNTSAGGTVVNDYLLGYLNPNLPFGGVNNSGIGKSFGKHGFVEFSNERGVIKRKFGTMDFIFPPYSDVKHKIAKAIAKWG